MKHPITVIKTERMVLRPVSVDDATDIYEKWTSDDHVARYMRWIVHESAEVTAEWLRAEVEGNVNGTSYQWAFTRKEGGYLFGTGGIFMNEDESCYEIGYQIMYNEWNKGFATEAAMAIIDFALNTLHEKEIVAGYMVGNDASGRVMEKCGFVYEKNAKALKFDGKTVIDTKRYRLKMV
jgi:ribosomal-protein-alanine N-acetyltransferase